jgi:hypothetical protein
MNTQHTQQHVRFPGNHVETLAEAEAMLEAVSTDADKQSDPVIRSELRSLGSWIETRINNHKC